MRKANVRPGSAQHLQTVSQAYRSTPACLSFARQEDRSLTFDLRTDNLKVDHVLEVFKCRVSPPWARATSVQGKTGMN